MFYNNLSMSIVCLSFFVRRKRVQVSYITLWTGTWEWWSGSRYYTSFNHRLLLNQVKHAPFIIVSQIILTIYSFILTLYNSYNVVSYYELNLCLKLAEALKQVSVFWVPVTNWTIIGGRVGIYFFYENIFTWNWRKNLNVRKKSVVMLSFSCFPKHMYYLIRSDRELVFSTSYKRWS